MFDVIRVEQANPLLQEGQKRAARVAEDVRQGDGHIAWSVYGRLDRQLSVEESVDDIQYRRCPGWDVCGALRADWLQESEKSPGGLKPTYPSQEVAQHHELVLRWSEV